MVDTTARPPRRSLLRRILRGIATLVGLLAIGVGVLLFILTRVETRALDPHLHLLLDKASGNTLVLDSDEGPLVVDTKIGPPASTLKKEVARLCGKPVKMVIDTHYHPDHTHGNPNFAGAEFVAHRRTREHLLALDAATFGPGQDGANAVPTTLIEDGKQFQFGDDYVDVRYLGRGHTDGDVVVFLHKRSILHAGDLFLNGYYPVMDPKGGGSMRELGPTLDKIITIGARTVIPGHGPPCTTAEVVQFREYVRALWDHVLASVRAGKSRGETHASFDASRFHLSPMPFFSSLAKNLDAAYDEAVVMVREETSK